MIKKLKTRFIVLAMISLVALMSLIVAGMNIASYRNVVGDADRRLEVLEENASMFLNMPPDGGTAPPLGDKGGPGAAANEGKNDGAFYGKNGAGGPSISRDEAEEARFFTVTLDENGDIEQTHVERISSIDTGEAEDMAKQAAALAKDKGFIDDFRYSVSKENGRTAITFLDCGRMLDTFRGFLRASILMSLLGLIIVFFVILYFAGRIVKPVAESYEKQKRFITDAGHEIKTPLAIIKANIDLMGMDLDEENVDRDELRESLGDINDQVSRLTDLTNDLVYLSRMEEGGGELVMSELPFSDIVSETVSSFEPLAREKEQMITSDITPMITVKGSSKELEKLLSILLENAVKYSPDPRNVPLRDGEDGMPAPTEISVKLRKDAKNALLEVRNRTKTELTDENLAHVFDRFYRTDSSRNSATGGHGIGLSMANAIVSAHSGKISAHTTDGHDFIVTASIPLA